MAHNNGIITKPINVRADIAYILGRSTGDVGQLYWDKDASGQAISSPAVKMWSRHKPVPWSVGGVKNVNPQGAHPNDWYKGVNGDFGIIARVADTTNVLSYIDGDLNGWVYERDSMVARVLDFENYYHSAPNPFDSLFMRADRVAVSPGGTLTFQYQLRAGAGATDYALGIVELNSGLDIGGVKKYVSELYAAFIIFQKSGSTYTYYDWCSASETLSDLESDPAMHAVSYTAPSTVGDYLYVPVMTTFKKETSSQAISSFVTIPGTEAVEFSVSNFVNPYMRVDAFVINSGTSSSPNYNNTIYFYCDFYGGTNGGSFNNIALAFETGNGVAYKTLTNVQNAGSATPLNVDANASARRPSGSGNVYSVAWDSQSVSLENLVRSLGGKARIYPASGSTISEYSILIREAAGMPGGTVIPF